MAFGLSSKNHTSPIAIDFGSDTLKVLQIDNTDRTEVVAAGAAVLPEDVRSDATARVAFLEQTLKTLLRSLPFRGRRAMLSIPAYQTLIHNFTMARCDDEDVDAMVDLQLQERLGVPGNRMVTRNTKTADHHRGGSARTDVACLAAKREMVMSYLQLAGRCRLEVVGMHPEPIALIRALNGNGSLDERALARLEEASGPCRLVLDLGHATSRVLVLEGGRLRLARTIHAGGLHFTRQEARQSSLSFFEARARREKEAATATEVPTCQVTNLLVEELQMSLRHHRSRHASAPVEKLLVCGGEAASDMRLQGLSEALNLPVERFDPLAKAARSANAVEGFDPDGITSAWAVPWGLCHSELNL